MVVKHRLVPVNNLTPNKSTMNNHFESKLNLLDQNLVWRGLALPGWTRDQSMRNEFDLHENQLSIEKLSFSSILAIVT